MQLHKRAVCKRLRRNGFPVLCRPVSDEPIITAHLTRVRPVGSAPTRLERTPVPSKRTTVREKGGGINETSHAEIGGDTSGKGDDACCRCPRRNTGTGTGCRRRGGQDSRSADGALEPQVNAEYGARKLPVICRHVQIHGIALIEGVAFQVDNVRLDQMYARCTHEVTKGYANTKIEQ